MSDAVRQYPEQEDGAWWRRFAGPAVIVLAALVATAPQLMRGNSCGHDFDFHLVSWFDALQSWRQGIVYPHWCRSANFGAGEPRFIFYPPLSWMLGAALRMVTPWKAVPMAMTFLMLAATGLATRALARLALANGPATLAGCTALFSGYTLFTAYERSDFGELAGGFWIPLVLLFIFRDRNPSGRWRQRALDGSTVPLALAVAGAWLSNPPLGVIASYLLAGVALTLALLWRSWAPVVRSALAVALGLGLCALYLVPAAVEQRWVDIRQAVEDPGYNFENNWLFARHANPALELHDVELFKASAIAVTMIAVALGALVICRLRGKLPGGRRWWLPLALIPVVVLFLQFPVSAFVWNGLPRVRFLQFPWRCLVAVEAPMGILFASAVWVARRRWRLVILSAVGVLFLAATATAGFNFFQACDEEDAVWAMVDTYRSGAGFEGVDEYEPPNADSSTLAMDLPLACLTSSPDAVLGQGSAGAELEWTPGSCEATYEAAPNPGKAGSEHLRVTATTSHAGYLVLRLRSFPAWQIRVNRQIPQSLPVRTDGLIVVAVPKGPVEVTVDWTTTRDAVAGGWLSGLALALLTGLCIYERKAARARLS